MLIQTLVSWIPSRQKQYLFIYLETFTEIIRRPTFRYQKINKVMIKFYIINKFSLFSLLKIIEVNKIYFDFLSIKLLRSSN
jgi:hypothetical protein